MTLCDYCGMEIELETIRRVGTINTGGNYDIKSNPITLPFECYRCGGKYCSTHRLPEAHSCRYIEDHIPHQDGMWFDRGNLPPSIEVSTNKKGMPKSSYSERPPKTDISQSKEESILKEPEFPRNEEKISEPRTVKPNKIHICQYCNKKVSQVYNCAKCSLELCSEHASNHSCIKGLNLEPSLGEKTTKTSDVKPEKTSQKRIYWINGIRYEENIKENIKESQWVIWVLLVIGIILIIYSFIK